MPGPWTLSVWACLLLQELYPSVWAALLDLDHSLRPGEVRQDRAVRARSHTASVVPP